MDSANQPAPASSSAPSRTAFDRLDTLVRVTSVHSWAYLSILFAVGAGAVIFALLYQVPTKVEGEGILLIEQDRLVFVRARATGRLQSLAPRPGYWVEAGAVIGRIAQEELEDQISQADARLAELRRQDQALTQFEVEEKGSKDAALDRVRDAVLHAQADGREKLKIAAARRHRCRSSPVREVPGRPRAAGVAREVLRRPR